VLAPNVGQHSSASCRIFLVKGEVVINPCGKSLPQTFIGEEGKLGAKGYGDFSQHVGGKAAHFAL